VAQHADVIITMLPDTPDVEKVLFAENGIVEGLQFQASSAKIIIDMSSISPLKTRQFAERIVQLGCDYVDAPVSGGDVGAQNATLTIMVGASTAVFEKIKPILGLMGKTVTHVGENGAGQICKVANQIIVSSTIEAVAEALLFASKAGADPEKVRQALLGGFAASRVLEVHGERMIQRRFEPGFRIELHQKDLDIALESASALGVSLPNTATVRELFSACLAHGGAKWDNSAIVKMLEKLANHEIQKHPE
jgi:2-hydroxy-3-oxopropionate reductase